MIQGYMLDNYLKVWQNAVFTNFQPPYTLGDQSSHLFFFCISGFILPPFHIHCTVSFWPQNSKTDWPIYLKIDSNSVHCLCWLAVIFEPDLSICSWDIWSQSWWILRSKRNRAIIVKWREYKIDEHRLFALTVSRSSISSKHTQIASRA